MPEEVAVEPRMSVMRCYLTGRQKKIKSSWLCWGEDDTKAVNVGDTVVAVTDGYVKFFRGELSITKGSSGQMEVNPE